MTRNRLFVISGPAGVGKGTVVKLLRQRHPELALSISATTRAPRPGEVEGVSYYFMDESRFMDLVEHGGFLEWAHVHGHLYGTPKAQVEDQLSTNSLILEIDPQGALNVRRLMPEAVLLFIAPPSIDELRARLTGRGTETPEELELRMKNALGELALADKYDEVIVNDDLTDCVENLSATITYYENC